MGLFSPSTRRSGLLRVTVVAETMPEDPDHDPGWYRLEKIEAAAGQAEDVAEAEVEWFQLEWDALGVEAIDGEKHRDDATGGEFRRMVVTGTMWSRHYSTCDGDDYDGGFDVELVEELVR